MHSSAQFENVTLAKADTFVVKAQIDSPVRTSFGAMNDRSSVLIRLEDKDGAYGWGEIWCNFPHVGAEHRANLVSEVLLPLLKAQNEIDITQLFSFLTLKNHILKIQCGEPGPISQSIAGLDIAIWDLVARRRSEPLYRLFHHKTVERVPVYASGINPQGSMETITACREKGYRAFKLKVGFGTDSDIANISRIAMQLRANEVLMLDANQAWTLPQANDFLAKVSDIPIEWLEEPLPADRPQKEWAELSSASPFPLAAGENIRGVTEFTNIISAGYVSVIQPDVTKWGGVTGCLEVARKAIEAGRQYFPHYLGGGIGLVASAHILAATGGNGRLEVDVTPNPLREGLAFPFPEIRDCFLAMPNGPGLGVEPEPEIIKNYLVLHKQIII